MKLRDRTEEFSQGFISESLRHEFRRNILERDFILELAYLNISDSDFDRAKYLINSYYQQFLQKWGLIHPLATVARLSAMKHLQVAVELEEFLFCLMNLVNHPDEPFHCQLKFGQNLAVKVLLVYLLVFDLLLNE